MTARIEQAIIDENRRVSQVVEDADITDFLYDVVASDEQDPDMDEDDIIRSVEVHADNYIDFITENYPERILS